MKFTIQLLTENTDRRLPLSIHIDTLDRPCEHIEDVGLQFEEAKTILRRLQDEVVRSQLADYLGSHCACSLCQRLRGIKGYPSALATDGVRRYYRAQPTLVLLRL